MKPSFLRSKGVLRITVSIALTTLVHQTPHAAATFVQTNGRYLILNGQPLYLHGVNQYNLFYQSQAMVDEILQDAASLGVNVLRTWASCEGAGYNGYCFQPQPRVYDEATFRKLDYVMYRAGQLNLRLVLPLVNNWPAFGGMDQYVAWCGSTAGHDDFYRNACSKSLYQDYVRTVLTRVNTYTGVAYRDDPTILLWQLANEPRCESDPTGNTLLAWVSEMSAFIKSIDPNHLVATGEEGWYTNKGTDWRHNGSKGADFLRNSQVGSIDVASFHLYPLPYQLDETGALAWIDEHVGDAHQVIGKPVVLGEFGWKVPRQVFGDFSTGTETWQVDWGYTTASPQRVASPSQNANGAIVYTPQTKLPAGGSAGGQRLFPDPGIDARPYQTLSGWVYIPSTAPADMRAVLYTKSGSGWTWREGASVALAQGAWTQVSMDTALVYQPDFLRAVGIKIFNGVTAYTGPIYHDLVTAFSSLAGSTMADRNRIYGNWYQRLDADDVDGAVVWLLAGHQDDTTFTPDADGYSVYYPEDAGTSQVIANYSSVVATKNATATDQPPSVTIQAPASGATVAGQVTNQATATDDKGVSGATYAIDGGAPQAMVLVSGVWTAVWNSTAVADGSHTIKVTATDTIGQTGSAQVTVTVKNTVATPTMSVKSITVTLSRNGKGGVKKRASATVAVVDQTGAAVSRAAVSTHWSGAATDSDVTTTDSSGLAKNIASNDTTASTGYFRITVDNITKSGLTYDPSKNLETSDQVNF